MAYRPEEMANFESVQRLFGKVSDGSKKVFAIGLAHYANYMGSDPDTIIDDRKRTWRDGLIQLDEDIKRIHEEKFSGFAAYLKGLTPPLSSNSVKTYMSAASAFYGRNFYPLIKPEIPAAHNIRILHTPTLQEMGVLLTTVDDDPLKMGAMAAAFQSGQSASDLLALRWDSQSPQFGTVKEQLERGIVHIHATRVKSGVEYDSFLGHLTVSILKRDDYQKTDPLVFPLSVRKLELIFQKASRKAKLVGVTSPHAARRFFTTQLKMAGFNESLVESWTAHALTGVRGSYFKPSPEAQLQEYKRAERFLTPPQYQEVLS